MYIKFENFRCYKEKTFELGEKGLTLISGMSGVGKSTILLGINFALYGKGNKLIKFGEKSCNVLLVFNDLKIFRSKRPNRLVVNDKYEDDAGQSLIYNLFGNNFDITGYISQNSLNSFILMSPSDKLEFIEKFAIDDTDLSSKKEKCKKIIKERKDDLLEVTSKLENTEELFETMEKPEKVIFPKKTKNKQKHYKNEQIRLKNCGVLIKKNNKKINRLKELENNRIVYNNKFNSLLKNLYSKKQDLLNFKQKCNSIYENLDEKYEENKCLLKNIINNRELVSLINKYNKDQISLEEIQKEEIKELKNKIKSLEDTLWIEYEKDEIDEEINNNKECLKDMKLLKLYNKENTKLLKDFENLQQIKGEIKNTEKNNKKYQKKVDDIKKSINKIKLQGVVLSCPECNSSLNLVNNELKIFEGTLLDDTILDNLEKDLEKYMKTIDKNNSLILDYKNIEISVEKNNKKIEKINEDYDNEQYDLEELEDNINILQEYKVDAYSKEKRLEMYKSKLDNNELSNTYKTLKKDLCKTEKKIQSLREKSVNLEENLDVDEEFVRNSIKEEEIKFQKIDDLEENISKCKEDKDNILNEIKNLKSKFVENEVDNIQEEIKKLEKDNEKLEKDKTKYTKNIQIIEKFFVYEKQLEHYNMVENKIFELNKREKECRDKYSSIQSLYNMILKAESHSIIKVINTINLEVKYFLDKFFVEEPMELTLKPFKQNKKSSNKEIKPQLNLEIMYKNMDCDINMLSGGEKSRVVLAYTLALGQIFNIPFLMLDESTASLDQELTTLVFNNIKETFEDKLVIVIAHQIITGVFNKIILL